MDVLRDGEVFATGVKQDNDIYRMFFKPKIPNAKNEVNVATTNLRVARETGTHKQQSAM